MPRFQLALCTLSLLGLVGCAQAMKDLNKPAQTPTTLNSATLNKPQNTPTPPKDPVGNAMKDLNKPAPKPDATPLPSASSSSSTAKKPAAAPKN
jgi:hypothetical protein